MVQVCCPVCGGPLEAGMPAWRCAAGHSFDVARQGYVNLLTVNRKHSRSPGDSPVQVAARREFLNAGYYTPLAERVCAAMAAERPQTLLDAGCGEGYYLACVGKRLPETERWGVDVSKEAVRFAAVRDRSAHWLTATAAHLPFPDGSFDGLLSMFALTSEREFRRVLRPGGLFLRVTAGPKHLLALRRLIYPEIRPKEEQPPPELEGFRLERSEVAEFPFVLTENRQIQNLLAMTPHFMRISRTGAERARSAAELQDTAQAVCSHYRAI